jgi:hypothetical protein
MHNVDAQQHKGSRHGAWHREMHVIVVAIAGVGTKSISVFPFYFILSEPLF